jgi:hypothetical protein
MIASRQIAFGGSAKRWENPYITDGLVAMWDGEWNAGEGKHDANMRKLCNLGSGKFWDWDFSADDGVEHGEKSLTVPIGTILTSPINGTDFAQWLNNANNNGSGFAVQYVCKPTSKCTNRLSYGILNTLNNFVFSLGEFYAIDSHPSYATTGRIFYVNSTKVSTDKYTRIDLPSTHCFSHQISTGVSKWFVDGVLQVEKAQNPTKEFNDQIIELNLFGHKKNNASIFDGDFFNLRFYNRALTDEEVAYNYEIDKARFGL